MKIIVNADDLGLTQSVNDAVFDAWEAGNISSATLMVNMPGAEDAAARAARHPDLGVGLHFCITEGTAITGPSSITRHDGAFITRDVLLKRAMRRQIDARDVRREFEAQIARATELGVQLTHADSHQHAMMLPAIMDAVVPILTERNLPVRLVSPPPRAVAGAVGRPRKLAKQLLNGGLAWRHRLRHSVRSNDTLVSVHDLDSPGPYTRQTYEGLLENAGQGTVEVMVHPYLPGDDLFAMYAHTMEAKRHFLDRCFAEHNAMVAESIFVRQDLSTFAEV